MRPFYRLCHGQLRIAQRIRWLQYSLSLQPWIHPIHRQQQSELHMSCQLQYRQHKCQSCPDKCLLPLECQHWIIRWKMLLQLW